MPCEMDILRLKVQSFHVQWTYFAPRYNLFKRVDTLMKKLKKKTVKLDQTFLPKRSKVLIKRNIIEASSPVPKPQPAKRQRPDDDDQAEEDDALDSQTSITSCFWDSQGRGDSPPSSPTMSPVKQAAHFPSKRCYIHSCSLAIHDTLACISLAIHDLRACALHEVQEIITMTKVVTQYLKEAADITCTCKTCEKHQRVDAVLSHALTSAQELIKLLERESHTHTIETHTIVTHAHYCETLER